MKLGFTRRPRLDHFLGANRESSCVKHIEFLIEMDFFIDPWPFAAICAERASRPFRPRPGRG